ncbi:MAG: helicase [Microvirga sp.]|nr:helicase [Microvirga sp.]
MLEAEITTTGDVTVEGQHIGHLHGFHFVPDPQADTTEVKTLRNAAGKALAGEIEARADRFAETPDTMLVLSNDGTIRWMGDPVAKLEPGDKLFDPKLRILSDEHLTGPARDKVDTRLRAWLKAYVVRLLGPLLQLEDSQELQGLARGIGFQIGEALGVLERAKVLNDVRSLDQEARSALRKAGVRFGAYHLYLPALLKPAPRVLATQLWALQNGGLDQKGIDEIAHLAQSGRTSIPVDPEIGHGLYRAAGFRVLGGRAVRVDILERLADLIRPAISYRPGITPGEPPAGTADGEGFVPTVAMTSLVGCAGEDFATILKSLGYVMDRRPGPAITVPLVEAPRAIEPQAPAPEGEAAAPAEEASSEAAPAEPAEAAVGTEEIGAVAVEAPEASVSEQEVEVGAAEAVASPEGEAMAPIDASGEAAPAEAAPAEPEMIEVWRQGRRHHDGAQARQGRDARGGRHERGERSEPRQDRGDRRPRHGANQGDQAGERRPRPERRDAQGEGGRPQNRPPRGPGHGEGRRSEDRRGPRPDKRPDNRQDGGRERREKQPDPNSPFAKLMALKAQLEDNKK